MGRKFAKVTIDELEEKVNNLTWISDYDFFHKMKDLVKADLKVEFDCENFDTQPGHCGPKGLMGLNTLSNGLTYWGMCAGGDWEFPVFFIIYWDGKKLRGYIPTDGNPWNTTTKQAYGNDEDADSKNARKRWPDLYKDYEKDDFIEVDNFDFDPELIKQDIINRIQVA